jgi:hypothetical protein
MPEHVAETAASHFAKVPAPRCPEMNDALRSVSDSLVSTLFSENKKIRRIL